MTFIFSSIPHARSPEIRSRTTLCFIDRSINAEYHSTCDVTIGTKIQVIGLYIYTQEGFENFAKMSEQYALMISRYKAFYQGPCAKDYKYDQVAWQ
jgi:hypothetical protein